MSSSPTGPRAASFGDSVDGEERYVNGIGASVRPERWNATLRIGHCSGALALTLFAAASCGDAREGEPAPRLGRVRSSLTQTITYVGKQSITDFTGYGQHLQYWPLFGLTSGQTARRTDDPSCIELTPDFENAAAPWFRHWPVRESSARQTAAFRLCQLADARLSPRRQLVASRRGATAKQIPFIVAERVRRFPLDRTAR